MICAARSRGPGVGHTLTSPGKYCTVRRIGRRPPRVLTYAMLGIPVRDPEIIETELMEISAILDDTIQFERILA